MMRCADLLTASCLVASAAIAPAECSWRLGWPTDERIWAVPWGSAPRGDFLTRMDCERAIDTMLGEAIRGQALLIELPACVCIPGYDNFAQEGIRQSRQWAWDRGFAARNGVSEGSCRLARSGAVFRQGPPRWFVLRSAARNVAA